MSFADTYGPHQAVIRDPNGQPPILVGNAPLAYMVDVPCTVRVMDVESKKTLATGAAKSGQIVVIDAEHGVRIGDKLVKPGPLDPVTRYGIFLEAK